MSIASTMHSSYSIMWQCTRAIGPHLTPEQQGSNMGILDTPNLHSSQCSCLEGEREREEWCRGRGAPICMMTLLHFGSSTNISFARQSGFLSIFWPRCYWQNSPHWTALVLSKQRYPCRDRSGHQWYIRYGLKQEDIS